MKNREDMKELNIIKDFECALGADFEDSYFHPYSEILVFKKKYSFGYTIERLKNIYELCDKYGVYEIDFGDEEITIEISDSILEK